MIPYKWVYKQKRDNAGHVQRLKARLAAKGFYQIYRQTILILTASPVARLTSTRILYALSVMLNLKFRQLDVETAFPISTSTHQNLYRYQQERCSSLRNHYTDLSKHQ